ncbi:MAG: hypothetical protein ACO3ND_00155 [Opitutales bacterium]
MEDDPQDQDQPAPPVLSARARRSIWRRLGGEGLTISLAVHLLLILLAAFWVVATVTTAAKRDPDTFATGAGGGNGGERNTMDRHKTKPRNIKAVTKTPTRITSKSPSSSLAVAALPAAPMSPISGGLLSGSGSKGFGGGAGGGIGSGLGGGRGGRNFVSMFGARGSGNLDGLIGTFYDIKQTKDRKPTASMTGNGAIPAYRKVIQSFVDGGWSVSRFSGFYRAPDQLIASQLWIPSQSANAAPKAFGVENEVKPSRWVVHYRCMIEAPSSMPFRFVGSGDDWLVVRWDRKIALDDGYERIEVGGDGKYKDFGQTCKDQFKINRKPGSLDRLMAGPWIKPVKGQKVPFEVLMGETPGGVFDMYLAIEPASSEMTTNGKYSGTGRLKLFRCATGPLPSAILKEKRGVDIDMAANDWIFKATRDISAPTIR